MEKIVCAIRGGASSRQAQERAIVLAQERDGMVIFVHVIDTDLIQRMDTSLEAAVFIEMENIGGALLTIAVERAQARGVKAEKILRRGSVPQTLEDILREVQASTIVLGPPNGDSGSIFTEAQFDQFVERLHTLGIQVQIAQLGDP